MSLLCIQSVLKRAGVVKEAVKLKKEASVLVDKAVS